MGKKKPEMEKEMNANTTTSFVICAANNEGHVVNKTRCPIVLHDVEEQRAQKFEVPGRKIWQEGGKVLTSEGYMVTLWENRDGWDKARVTELMSGRGREMNREAARLFTEMMRLKPDPMMVTNPNPKLEGVWIQWVDGATCREFDRPDRVQKWLLLRKAPEGRYIPNDTTPDMVWMKEPWLRSGTVRVKLVDEPPQWWREYLKARKAYYEYVGKPKEVVDPTTP